ncbi:MAG: hypothetical protein ACREJU_11930, partial [Nitrospiraceae bacterium]
MKNAKLKIQNVVGVPAFAFCIVNFTFFIGLLPQAHAFKIVSPDDSSVLRSGATVPAKVDL